MQCACCCSVDIFALYELPCSSSDLFLSLSLSLCLSLLLLFVVVVVAAAAVKHAATAATHYRGVVPLGLPDRGWWPIEFVRWKRSASLVMVLWVQFNFPTISSAETLAPKSLIALPLSWSSRLSHSMLHSQRKQIWWIQKCVGFFLFFFLLISLFILST